MQFIKLENPTHGSGWIFSDPTYIGARTEFLNPTNGSWWIVHIPPRNKAAELIQEQVQFQGPFYVNEQVGSEQSTNFRWWDS